MRVAKIVVCAKQVPDPEVPFSAVKVDSEKKRIITMGTPQVINPFDENAIEAALRIKEQNGAEITVLSVGEKVTTAVLSKAIAVGADKLILLQDSHFKDLNSYSTANVLSNAIKKIKEYDVILTGRQGGDWDSGQTGLILAEMLEIVSINLARSIKIEDDKLVVEKLIPDGYELVKVGMPALVTVSNEVGELRYASVQKLLKARKGPVEIWRADDISIDLGNLRSTEIIKLSPPPDMRRQCHFMDGNSPEERGENLAIYLKQ